MAVTRKTREECARLSASLRALEPVLPADLAGLLSAAARQGAWELPAGLPSAPQERLALAQAAVAHHAGTPTLITFSGLQPSPSLSKSANKAIQVLHDGLIGRAALDETAVPPDGALICFGAGLHIPMLLNTYPTRDLVIVEPHPGALCQVFADLDWQGVLDRVIGTGGRLSVICHGNPVVAAMGAVAALRGGNIGLIDGSRLVIGYRDEAVAATANAFMERRVNLVVYNGYVEDEDLLLGFASENILNRGALTLDRVPDRHAEMPAVIVGSGPSLDASLSALKRNRDKVAVFSCGSALLALLENGIRPDAHCELEADPYIDDILRYSATGHDLSAIRLIAANTVYPDILGYFNGAALCFREGTLASRILGGGADPLPLIAPSCTNTGASFAHAMGFREIALCGVDLGARAPDRHHAASTVYDRVEDYNAFVGEDRVWMQPKSSASTLFHRKVPANFGGEAYTNDDMLQMRTAFELLAARHEQARFLNLSDGARIAGFEAVQPDTYLNALPVPDRTPGSVLETVFSRLAAGAAARPIDPARLDGFLGLLNEWEKKAVAVFSDAGSLGSAVALYDALAPLLQPDESAARSTDLWEACRYAHTGSLLKVFHYLRYADARLTEAGRQSLLRLVGERLPPIVSEMTALLRSRVSAVRSKAAQ